MLQKVEDNKIKADNAYLAEIQNNFKLTRQFEKYMDESINAQNLEEAKENIWIDINSTISYVWT